jgi:hypothetical protein
MSLPIQNYRSSTPGLQPPSLLPGQLFFNVADRVLYTGDGSDNNTAFDGTQTPGVPGQGWFATQLSQTNFDKLYVPNPSRYGDTPFDKQVLMWDGTKDHPVWGSIEPGGHVAAKDVDYDPQTSGLQAIDVQDAIDEVVGRIKTNSADIVKAGSEADRAFTLAGEAQGSANLAKETADAAQTAADGAKADAAAAQQAAEAAQTKADQASTEAGAAQATADQAKSDATAANQTAADAQTVAAKAQQDATGAVEKADSALEDANQAQAAANEAVTMSNDAKTQAQAAQTAADAANTAAVNAQKTADAAVVAPQIAPQTGEYLGFDGNSNVWKALSDATQLSNTLYVNSDIKDLQAAINAAGLYNTIYVATGAYGGEDLTINGATGLNIVGPHCPDGCGIAFIGNKTNARKVLIGGTSTRVRLTDMVVEGGMVIDGSQGRHSFDNVSFNGPVILRGNVESFVEFENCTFGGGLTIEESFKGSAGFLACDMGSNQIISVKTTDPSKILFGNCFRFLAFPSNAILAGENQSATGFTQFSASKITGDSLITRKFTPLAATSPGEAGRICWDDQYVYVCVASNTWKRAALTSW